MEAIILAGGFGTRLQHIVSDVPKPMAPILTHYFVNRVYERENKNVFRRSVSWDGAFVL